MRAKYAVTFILLFGAIVSIQAQKKTVKPAKIIGNVWVTVPNYASLGIVKKSTNSVSSTNQSLDSLIAKYTITTIEKATPGAKSARLNKTYEIQCICDPLQLKDALLKMSNYFKDPEVMPEPTPLFTPNDYDLAFNNDYALDLIDAKGAWDITKGDTSIVIAVLEKDFYINHPELTGKYNVYTPPPTGAIIGSEDMNHGTRVAITAAGNTNNRVGKSSIGYNCRLQLRQSNWGQILQAVNSGARIINLSFFSQCTFNSYQQDIINEAHSLGAVLIASAGNAASCGGQNNPCYPAAYDHVISVSSIGPNDNHERIPGNPATAHNHHSTVDICAPGYGVAVSGNSSTYDFQDGTSYAAPLVSGTVALMLSVNKCLTPEQVEEILYATAVDIYPKNPAYAGKLGAGRLNAKAAVQMAANYATKPPVTADITFDCTTKSQGLTINTQGLTAPYVVNWNTGHTGISMNNLNPGTYSATLRDASGCVAKLNPITLNTVQPIDVKGVVTNVDCFGSNTGSINTTVTGGIGNYTYIWSNGQIIADPLKLPAGTYNLRVKDSKGCQSSTSFNIEQAPKLIATIVKSDGVQRSSGALDLTVTGGTAPYSYSWNTGAKTQDISNLKKGTYQVEVIDAKGCKANANAIISVIGNYKPPVNNKN